MAAFVRILSYKEEVHGNLWLAGKTFLNSWLSMSILEPMFDHPFLNP